MDLTIGKTFRRDAYIPDEERKEFIDPLNQESIDDSFMPEAPLPEAILPGERWLICTVERLMIPTTCKGDVKLRSTWARLGLMIPATVADPGFIGNLTIEIFNANKRAILIRPGSVMISMIYSSIPYVGMPKDEINYALHGRYQGQSGITLPKALTE